MLEKTLECSLYCKEINPVNLKGNQPWIFPGRLMLKLKLQYFGHLKRTTNTLEKTLMRAKIEGRRGWQRMSCLASLMPWTWTGANSGRWWGTGKPGMLHSMGFMKNGTRLGDWAKTINIWLYVAFPALYENNVYYYWDNVRGYIFILSLWNLIRVYIACLLSPVWIFVTPLTVGHQAPLSM